MSRSEGYIQAIMQMYLGGKIAASIRQYVRDWLAWFAGSTAANSTEIGSSAGGSALPPPAVKVMDVF
ncbi:hypothetical protein [Hoeflea sp.]|uniref:hypothetical protein n=1 Tax=Hoeflea sp. TaxID=1940281 RepID=UPI0019A2AB64|nr:hypothetical protein [Hoeflea sp.]MBC7284021.1 hypothetical protein [Hoeflea sp.]